MKKETKPTKKENKQTKKPNLVKLEKATIVFSYVFTVITILAAIILTYNFITQRRKNDVAEILLFLLFTALAAMVVYAVFAIVYFSLLAAKIKYIDPLVNKKAKVMDIVCVAIGFTLTLFTLIVLILRTVAGDDSSDLSFILLIVGIDANFIVTLVSTIYNTVQYAKVLKPTFKKQKLM